MKKLILFVAGLLLFSFVLTKPAQAFSTPEKGYQLLFEQAVWGTPDEMNLQSFVYEVTKAITAATIINPIIGCLSCEEGEGSRGIIAATGFFIAGMYASPPASGIQYMADLGRQIGIVQPVYAQGQGKGFQAMTKVMPVWKAFRNISYVFFILIFIFVGFAIMFRVKINPQTVVTIQSALPKIILALILVTFSYAIVGFMLDLMYVFLGLARNVFLGRNGLIRNQFDFLGDALTWLEENTTTLIPGAAGIVAKITDIILIASILSVIVIAIFIFGPISWIFSVIVAILFLIAVLRCAWTLLKAYTMIIINLIFAPFQILIGALPGNNSIGAWFKNLLANILVLPTMFLMFYLSVFLTLAGIKGLFPDNLAEFGLLISNLLLAWVTIPGSPVAGTIMGIVAVFAPGTILSYFSSFLFPIIGLVILLMAPKVADMIKSFITQKPFEYGTAIGEAMGPAKAVAGLGWGAVQKGTIDYFAGPVKSWWGGRVTPPTEEARGEEVDEAPEG